MELFNNTNYLMDYYEYLDRNGMEYALILLRARYKLKAVKNNTEVDWILVPDENQGELFDKDIHYDDDPNASILFEKDRVDFKLTTDLIFNGYSYAPEEEFASSWQAEIKVGNYEKKLNIYGPRSWIKQNDDYWILTNPIPCDKVAIRYENAYGGKPSKNIDEDLTYFNPVGKSVFNIDTSEIMMPAHQIEHPDEIISNCNESHYPQGLGFVNREWEPRKTLRGEDPSFASEDLPPIQANSLIANQASPLEAIPEEFLIGNETITLINLLKGKACQKIRLPDVAPFMWSETDSGKQYSSYLPLDTIVLNFMEEENYVFLHWRFAHSNPAEIKRVSIVMEGEQ